MSRMQFGFVALLVAVAACTAPAEKAKQGAGALAGDASATGGAGATVDGGMQQAAPQRSAADEEAEATFRKIWQEPAFQRELAESYLRGSEVEPALTQREAQFRMEVLSLINEQKLDAAISRLQSLQGDQAVWDFMLGNIYLGQDRFQDAALEYTKAVAQESNYRRAWQNLAFAQMRNNQFEAARDALVRVLSLGGASASTYGFLGMMHGRTGDYLAAESAFRMVMMLEPNKESWRILLAESLYNQARFAEVASLTGMLLEKDPNRADLWLRQAEAYVGMGETKKASENLEIVDQLGGSNYDSLKLLGNIYFNSEAFDLAVDAYLRALKSGADRDHRPMLDLANRLAVRSAYGDSKRLLQGIEATYGSQLDTAQRTELRKLQVRLAVAEGATAEQVALLQQIVADNPLDGDALLQLGRYYQQAGDVETAILRFQQAAQNDNFAVDAKVLHAQLLVGESRFAEALPLLQQAQGLKRRDDVQKLLEFVERAASRSR